MPRRTLTIPLVSAALVGLTVLWAWPEENLGFWRSVAIMRQTSRRMKRSSGSACPALAAARMMAGGSIGPWRGWLQRISASIPARVPPGRRSSGW